MYVWSSNIAEYGSTGYGCQSCSWSAEQENNISLSPCVPGNLVSRDGFSRPVPRQPAHHHTQAESGAYLRNSSRGIVHRNRKRFLLSQSTLREEFVEKKYQVFDIIGLLTILVQVNLSSPVERV